MINANIFKNVMDLTNRNHSTYIKVKRHTSAHAEQTQIQLKQSKLNQRNQNTKQLYKYYNESK